MAGFTTKVRLGIDETMFLQEKGRPTRIVFLRVDFDGQNRSSGTLIDVACSTVWLKMSTF
jgi:hypothetical protein